MSATHDAKRKAASRKRSAERGVGPGRYRVTGDDKVDHILSWIGARWITSKQLSMWLAKGTEEITAALKAGHAAGVVELREVDGLEAWRRPVPTETRKIEPGSRGPVQRAQARTLRIDEIEGDLAGAYQDGARIDELADRYRLSPRTISARLKAMGVTVRRPGTRLGPRKVSGGGSVSKERGTRSVGGGVLAMQNPSTKP